MTRKMLRVALESEGYAAIEAADARTALAAVAEGWPDLVLQDLMLPDMDGIELLRRLRALPGGLELPILALSGFLSRLEESRDRRRGLHGAAGQADRAEPSRRDDPTAICRDTHPRPALVGAGRRVLVVDDDPFSSSWRACQFTHLGFERRRGRSARRALAAARLASAGRHPERRLHAGHRRIPAVPRRSARIRGWRGARGAGLGPIRIGRPTRISRSRVGANALVAADAGLRAARRQSTRPSDGAAAGIAGRAERSGRAAARAAGHSPAGTAAGGMPALTQRCALQAAQLSLLSGVADALAHDGEHRVAIRDVLAATLDAAGISKGALILQRRRRRPAAASGHRLFGAERQPAAGTSSASRARSSASSTSGGSVSVPSVPCPGARRRPCSRGASVASMQIVPLISRRTRHGRHDHRRDAHRRHQRRLDRVRPRHGQPDRPVAGAPGSVGA